MSILNQKDRDVIILASTIRGDIKCVQSIERKCGYIIRPELWFTNIEAGAARALSEVGLTLRTTYSKENEISKILQIIKGLEDLSSTTSGLMMVKTANGVLVQPNTHQEVKDALDYLDEIREVNSKADVR
tara:strand:+ start:2552 stop:2941 length:390 start_codon:yes stop_codon:yes gene_type:complete